MNGGRVAKRGMRRVASVPVFAGVIGIAGAVVTVPIYFGVSNKKVMLSWQNAFASDNRGSGSDNSGSDSSDSDSGSDDSRRGSDDSGRGSGSDSSGTGSETGGSGGISSGGTEHADRAESSDRGRDEPSRHGVGTHDGHGVAHAQFTTKFDRRLPANQVSVVEDPHQAVSFYTEIVGMHGQTVTHRWSYDGEVVYQVSSMINGSKWRFWSTQILPADKPGTWRVDVLDEMNTILRSLRLEYRPAG